MKFKKVVTFITCMTLILSLTVPAYGASTVSTQKTEVTVTEKNVSVPTIIDNQEEMDNANISKEKAKSIAKKAVKDYFDYDINAKDFQTRIEFRNNYMSKDYVWQLNWNKYGQNSHMDIDVIINSDSGKVISAHINDYENSNNRPKIPMITKEEAKVIAEEFMKKTFPEEYKEVKHNEDVFPQYNTSYQFNYQRYINDIPYGNNAISVTVNGLQSLVTGIYVIWDDEVDVPSIDKIIDKEAAEKVFQNNMEMNLTYIPCRGEQGYNSKIKEVKLVYVPDYKDGYMVDAKEGVMINTPSKKTEEKVTKDISDERKAEIKKQGSKIKALPEELSEEKADEIMTVFLKGIYGDDYQLSDIRYQENEDFYMTNGKKSWYGHFMKNEGYYSMGGNIVIDALTGQLISANEYSPMDEEVAEEDFKPTITWEEGYDKAIEAIATYFPNRIMDIDTEDSYEKREHYSNGKLMPEYTYYYNFVRKVDDLTYRDDHISIEIDTKDGSISRIACQWNDEVEFPEISKSMSKQEAEAIYFEKYQPELMYARINETPDEEEAVEEIKLVYRLDTDYYSGNYIDASTGKFLNYSGQEVNEDNKRFNELIKDHPAKKELSLLAAGNILDVENFELDNEVTLMEAVKMLVLAKGYHSYMTSDAESLGYTNIDEDDENYKYLQMAVVYGIVENTNTAFGGDKKINREELAELIVKLLGYQEVANIDGIFKVTCNDAYKISKEHLGDVAICNGLDIMKTNDMNAFKPKDNVTIVDMALVVFNTLSKINNDGVGF